jgi:hypothetical protein
MYDLGIVARLDSPEPSRLERVAPAIYYHSQPPKGINGYRFAFKTADDARLTASVVKDGGTAKLHSEVFRRQRGGRPFTVRWSTSLASPGSYSLVLDGFLLQTNEPVTQTVRFVHPGAIP